MPAATAASISPVNNQEYAGELKERLLHISAEYYKALSLLNTDIEKNHPDVFSVHLELERAVFKRFSACIKVWQGLKIKDPSITVKIDSLVERQRDLQRRVSRKMVTLRGRLEKGTLTPRRKHLYDENVTFLDISC
ncbi:hypothetical protein [Marispirochaeta sp.]|jgi:hypothetical protein|uniref:hypothetical protein n=1 Tax=Marispirochaeta sp. TaxID=2038653 RepID=UPI0029C8E88F|nr:hypothetical protein [Marispirochaeta sp.]